VDPYGLDLSEPLVALAKKRLPDHTHHLFVGNAWTWTPPQAFDFVRTELVYVPNDLHRDYVKRILDQYLRPGGTLIAAEYLNKTNSSTTLGIDRYLSDLGFMVEDVKLGLRDGVEGARIAVVKSSWG
jgi:trans-aconitate methyltransferase